jgi:hypothetical protein
VPAGPKHDAQPRPQLWTDYPSFRAHVIRECLRIGKPAPNDKTLGGEYVQRRVELHRLVCWDRGIAPEVVDEEVAGLRQRWLGEVDAFERGRSR